MTEQQKAQLYLSLTAIGTAVLCHFLFSPYGFNPTDDGFVLSSAMRLLQGQVPHADIVTLRPLGYAYLHIPELLIGKEHTFLVSRLIFWLELSAIAYLWTMLLMESTKDDVRSTKYEFPILIFGISFLFNAHDFPIAVLHTIDGLLFALAGFYLVMRNERYGWLGGLLIGYAVLCKQGFAVLIPLLVFLYPAKRSAILSTLIPVTAYVTYVSLNGGWNNMAEQLSAHTELLETGLLKYVLNPWLFGGIVLNYGSRRLRLPAHLPFLLLVGFLAALLVSGHYAGQGLLLLFGYALTESILDPERRRLYILALALAWCVSISVGYASIALFSGGLLALLSMRFFEDFTQAPRLVLLGSILLGIASFGFARATHIYRDADRGQLTEKLDGTVRGASGIHTNPKTYAVLKELDSLQQAYPDLLVLPDFTACQLFDPGRPIRTEWPNRAEVPNAVISGQVIAPLLSDKSVTIAIARYQTALLADTLVAIDPEDYRILQFVGSRYAQTDSSAYFRLYSRP